MSGTRPSSRGTVTAPGREERRPSATGRSAGGSTPAAPGTTVVDHRAALRLDVEGLRGIAVGLVLLYHLGVPFLPGGFIGVDVFFVISGFLITGLLLREIDRTGRISLGRFYARRARRLLPAAGLVLLATAVGGWWLLPGSAHANLGRDVVASTLYVVNWELAARSVDYDAEADIPSALQHYWSLSVEEQFYVVWPVLIVVGLLLARRTGLRLRPLLLGTVVTLGAASLAWSVWLTADDPTAAYFVTTTRIWELALGAALAFAVGRLPSLTSRAAALLAWAGVAAVAGTALLASSSTPWPGWGAAVPTLGAAALLAAGTTGHATGPGRVLSSRPLVWLGGLSYAVYLWHWPIVVIADVRLGGIGLVTGVAVAALTLALAWVTVHVVEHPVRFSPRLAAGTARTLLVAAVTMAITVAAGAAVIATVPVLPKRSQVDVDGARALARDPGAEVWTMVDDPERAFDRRGELFPPPALAPKDAPAFRGCQIGPGMTEPRRCALGATGSDEVVALIGDSKMGQWLPAITKVSKQEDWRLEGFLKASCVFSRTGVPDECATHTANVLEQFAEEGAPDRVLVSQRVQSSYDRSGNGFEDALAELVEMGVEVAVVADNATPGTDALFTCVELHPDDYGACAFDRDQGLAKSGNPTLSQAARELDLPVVDVNEWICPVESCPPAIGGVLVYRQTSHITATYARTLTPVLRQALADIGWAKGSGSGGSRAARVAPGPALGTPDPR